MVRNTTPPTLENRAYGSCETGPDGLPYKPGMESPIESRYSADDSCCVDVTAVGALTNPPSPMVGFLLPRQTSEAAIGGEVSAAA